MPSKTPKQARFFRAELSKAKTGQKTKTGMSVEEIEHWVTTKKKGK